MNVRLTINITSGTPAAAAAEGEVHIIYTEQPPQGLEPETHHLNTLTQVIGSEEAAKGVLLYVYKHAACGFSAKLTTDQVEQLSKQPGVLQVVKSGTAQLHSGPAQTHNL